MRDALTTIPSAGHDTTALAPARVLAEIVPRPEIADRIGDELRRVTPGPERFRPERSPFVGGNRVCLGSPFALFEMKQ